MCTKNLEDFIRPRRFRHYREPWLTTWVDFLGIGLPWSVFQTLPVSGDLPWDDLTLNSTMRWSRVTIPCSCTASRQQFCYDCLSRMMFRHMPDLECPKTVSLNSICIATHLSNSWWLSLARRLRWSIRFKIWCPLKTMKFCKKSNKNYWRFALFGTARVCCLQIRKSAIVGGVSIIVLII